MNKQIDRFLLVILVVIGALIMLLAAVVGGTVAPEVGFFGTTAINVIFTVFALLFVIVSAILLFRAFSDANNVKKIVIYADCGTVTKTSLAVIKELVNKSTATIDGLRIKKVGIHLSEAGPALKLKVILSGDNINKKLESMRKQITFAFEQILRVTFASIDFDITKVKVKGKIAAVDLPKEEKATQEDAADKGNVKEEGVDEKSQPKTEVVEKDTPKEEVIEKDTPKAEVIENDTPKDVVVDEKGEMPQEEFDYLTTDDSHTTQSDIFAPFEQRENVENEQVDVGYFPVTDDIEEDGESNTDIADKTQTADGEKDKESK